MPADPAKGKTVARVSAFAAIATAFPAVAISARPVCTVTRALRDRMDTRLAYRIRDSYRGGARGDFGARVTPVNSDDGRRVILSERIRCAGEGDHSANDDFRCAPDLILAQRERADG